MRPATQAPLILVVDDYHDAREMCAEFLEAMGYRVAQAQDGREALEKAFSLLPDAILMDLTLPGIDGWEATRRLKSDARTRGTPVVVLTGHAADRGPDEADRCLVKPFEPDQLIREVEKLIQR